MSASEDAACGGSGRSPVAPVRREVLTATGRTARTTDQPPVLFVPGFGHGAWAFAEHWLEHAADAGLPGVRDEPARPRRQRRRPRPTCGRYVARRGPGGGRAAPAGGAGRARRRRAGGGPGAGPVPGPGRRAGRAGARRVGRWARRCAQPASGTLPALFGGRLRPAPGPAVQPASCRAEAAGRTCGGSGRAGGRAQWQLLRRADPEPPVGRPAGAGGGQPGRPVVPPRRWAAAAPLRRRAAAVPGHGPRPDAGARWREPIDAILDWLEKQTA